MIIAAEFYTKTPKRSAIVDIVRIENGSRQHIDTIPAMGKADARKMAAKYDAKPWNF